MDGQQESNSDEAIFDGIVELKEYFLICLPDWTKTVFNEKTIRLFNRFDLYLQNSKLRDSYTVTFRRHTPCYRSKFGTVSFLFGQREFELPMPIMIEWFKVDFLSNGQITTSQTTTYEHTCEKGFKIREETFPPTKLFCPEINYKGIVLGILKKVLNEKTI